MNSQNQRNCMVVACMILFAAGSSAAAPVDMQFTIVAQSGDPAPDGNGVFTGFGSPVLNNDGLMAVEGFLSTLPIRGLFLGDGSTALRQLVRAGEATPDGNGEYKQFLRPAINGNGQVAFLAFLRNTNGGISDDIGFFRADGLTAVVQLAREGEPAPDGNGTIGIPQHSPPLALNSSGEIGFQAPFTGTAGGVNDNAGVVRTDDNGALLQVVRKGDPAPDGVGMFETFSVVTMNDAGQVAFNTSLTNAGNTVIGIFLGNGTDPLEQIARAGQAIPDGSGNFDEFNDPLVNNAGQVVFAAFLAPFRQFPRDHGIYLSDGSGGLSQIARFGDLTPDSTATFTVLAGRPSLNDAGDVVFSAGLADAATGSDTSVGMYRGRDADSLFEIFGFNGAAPDGNGTFNSVFSQQVAINESAQVAFHATLTNTDGGNVDDTGIFFHDDTLGLLTVIREGDPFLDSTILRVDFGRSSLAIRQDEHSGLNDRGEVAFAYTLVNGDHGVAIWTGPSDAAPSVTITSPADAAVVEADEILVEGVATDDGEVVSVVVNGVLAELVSTENPDDPAEVFFSALVPLDPGENEIVAVVTDDGGNTTEARVIVESEPATEPRVCDANGDGSVDRVDIGAIFAARGTVATGPDDPRDVNGDGLITINDGRLCVLQCDNPNCAPTL